MYELLVAAKMLLTAPQATVGVDRKKMQAEFGRPESVGTDFKEAPKGGGPADTLVTLDWPNLRIRLYNYSQKHVAALVGVTTTSDVLKTGSAVRIGADRSTVLRELGAPFYEDEQQLVYSSTQDDPDAPNDTVRIVFRDDHVVGFDWTFPVR